MGVGEHTVCLGNARRLGVGGPCVLNIEGEVSGCAGRGQIVKDLEGHHALRPGPASVLLPPKSPRI